MLAFADTAVYCFCATPQFSFLIFDLLSVLSLVNCWTCHLLLYVYFLPHREREQLARFAQPGTFEFEYSSRWKALDEMEKQQREQVDRNIREAKEKLEAELESAKHEHQLMLMRQGRWTNVVLHRSLCICV